MIAAPVQCDVDRIPKRPHDARVPRGLGRPAGLVRRGYRAMRTNMTMPMVKPRTPRIESIMMLMPAPKQPPQIPTRSCSNPAVTRNDEAAHDRVGANEFAAEAPQAAEASRPDGDGVGGVRDYRRQPQREQGGERDHSASAGHRVDGAGKEGGNERNHQVRQVRGRHSAISWRQTWSKDTRSCL